MGIWAGIVRIGAGRGLGLGGGDSWLGRENRRGSEVLGRYEEWGDFMEFYE